VIPAAGGPPGDPWSVRSESRQTLGAPGRRRADRQARGSRGKGRVGRRAARSQRLLMGSVAFPPVGRLLDVGRSHPSDIKGSAARSAARGQGTAGNRLAAVPKGRKGKGSFLVAILSAQERSAWELSSPGGPGGSRRRLPSLRSCHLTNGEGAVQGIRIESFVRSAQSPLFKEPKGRLLAVLSAGLKFLHDASPSHRGRLSPPLYKIDG